MRDKKSSKACGSERYKYFGKLSQGSVAVQWQIWDFEKGGFQCALDRYTWRSVIKHAKRAARIVSRSQTLE